MNASTSKRIGRLERTIKASPHRVFATVGLPVGASDDDIHKMFKFIFWSSFNAGFNTPAGRRDWWAQEYLDGEVQLPESWSRPGRIDEATFWMESKIGDVMEESEGAKGAKTG
jgi:hypothetical protein